MEAVAGAVEVPAAVEVVSGVLVAVFEGLMGPVGALVIMVRPGSLGNGGNNLVSNVLVP